MSSKHYQLLQKPPISPFSFTTNNDDDTDSVSTLTEQLSKPQKRSENRSMQQQQSPPQPFQLWGIPQAQKDEELMQLRREKKDAFSKIGEKFAAQNMALESLLKGLKEAKETNHNQPSLSQVNPYKDELERLEMRLQEMDNQEATMSKLRQMGDRIFEAQKDFAVGNVKSIYKPSLSLSGGQSFLSKVGSNSMIHNLNPRQNSHPIEDLINPVVHARITNKDKRKKHKKNKKRKKGPQLDPEKRFTMQDVENQVKAILDSKLAHELNEDNPLREEQERVLEELQRGREVVEIEGGGKFIKPIRPNDRAMIVMPKISSSSSSASIHSESSRTDDYWDPMNKYLNTLATMKMMREMNEDEVDKNESSRKERKKREHTPPKKPIIIKVPRKRRKKSKELRKPSPSQEHINNYTPPAPPPPPPPRTQLSSSSIPLPSHTSSSLFPLPPPPPTGQTLPSLSSLAPAPVPAPALPDPIKSPVASPGPVLPSASSKKKLYLTYLLLKYLYYTKSTKERDLALRFEALSTAYKRDLPKFREWANKLVKQALFPTLAMLVKAGVKDSVDVVQGAAGDADTWTRLQERLADIGDALEGLAKFDERKEFGNVYVLSFLAGSCLPRCFLPDGHLTKYEFDRMKFNTFGQLSSELEPKLSKLLIGGFLLIRVLVYDICFHPKEHLRDFVRDSYAENNLISIGCCIYYTFLDIFEETSPNPNNTDSITHGITPRHLGTGLLFNQTSQSYPEELICDLPEKAYFRKYFSSDHYPKFRRSIIRFLNNMYLHVTFQAENENLPRYQKKLNSLQFWSKRLKRVLPSYMPRLQVEIDNTNRKMTGG